MTGYTIHTAGTSVIPPPDYNTANPNDWTRGSTTPFTFEFGQFTDTLTVSGSHTVSSGESEVYRTVTVEVGGTLTIESDATLQCDFLDDQGTVDNQGNLLIIGSDGAFREYAEYAGKYTTNRTLNSNEAYKDFIPTTLNIDSLVWGIEPDQSLKDDDIVGIYGLVDSVQNQRNMPLSTNRYQVDIYVLALFDEYENIQTLQEDLEL